MNTSLAAGLFSALTFLIFTQSAFSTETNRARIRIGPLQIYIGGDNHNEKVAVGHDLTVREGETLKEAVVVSGDALIEGTIERDLVVVLGKARLGPTAEVKGDLVVVGGRLEADPKARVGGERVIVELDTDWVWVKWLRDWIENGLLLARPLPHASPWVWGLSAAFVLFYILVAALLPGPIRGCVRSLETRPASAFLIGLLSFLLLGPLILLLLISVVGSIVIPFLFCAVVVGMLFGKLSVYQFAGMQLGHQTGLSLLEGPLAGLIVGVLLFSLLYAVPVLGILVWGLVATLGLGTVVMALFRAMGSEQAPALLVARSDLEAQTESVSPGEAGSLSAPVELARAGFWIRFCATVLDALLIGLVLAALGTQKYGLITWALYHFGLWSWMGTTVGGMLMGIKILRADGRQIDYAVALLRCLSAFFSAFVLFLGFFWAGWDRQKQSWHDKIAGTVVVKFPESGSRRPV